MPGFVRQLPHIRARKTSLKPWNREARHGWQMRLRIAHEWDIGIADARKIQEQLREKWIEEDRFGEIRTVAGLDAAFVLVGSQAFRRKHSRWGAFREANARIPGAVGYRHSVMQGLERAFAEVRLQVRYRP